MGSKNSRRPGFGIVLLPLLAVLTIGLTAGCSDGAVGASSTTADDCLECSDDTGGTAPVAVDGLAATEEDSAVTITLEATDPEGDSLTFALVDEPGNGEIILAGDEALYTPSADFNGSDSFTFTASDGSSDSEAATVTITITPVNDAPTITGTPVTSATEESAYTGFTVTGDDVDVSDSLTYSISGNPGWLSIDDATGELTGTPANADVGTSGDITITVTDDGALTLSADLAAFTITVINTNDAPTITGAPAGSVNEDSPYTFTPGGGDVDPGASLSYSITNKPAWAAFSAAAGALTGTPVNVNPHSPDESRFP